MEGGRRTVGRERRASKGESIRSGSAPQRKIPAEDQSLARPGKTARWRAGREALHPRDRRPRTAARSSMRNVSKKHWGYWGEPQDFFWSTAAQLSSARLSSAAQRYVSDIPGITRNVFQKHDIESQERHTQLSLTQQRSRAPRCGGCCCAALCRAVPCCAVLYFLYRTHQKKHVRAYAHTHTYMRRPGCFAGARSTWYFNVACLHLKFRTIYYIYSAHVSS